MKFHHNLDPSPSHPDFPGFTPPHLLKPKDTHSYYLYKHGQHWAFNHWQTQKYDEGLLNGSELALDWHYHKLSGEYPNYDSGLYATFALKPFDNFQPTTELHFLYPDLMLTGNPQASWYYDTTAEMNWWLCPFWGQLWGGKPPAKGYLYLTLDNNK